jgi:hypothetical protein
MALLFFYGHDLSEFGPYSPTQMRELAASCQILPTDFVWQDGVGRKLEAGKVKNLFMPAVALPELAVEELPEEPVVAPVPKAPRVEPKRPAFEDAKPKRVIRIKGGVLQGQDGHQVRFFKKCEVCSHQDPSRSTAVIRTGCMRVTFYCRPCRKSRSVEMFGVA